MENQEIIILIYIGIGSVLVAFGLYLMLLRQKLERYRKVLSRRHDWIDAKRKYLKNAEDYIKSLQLKNYYEVLQELIDRECVVLDGYLEIEDSRLIFFEDDLKSLLGIDNGKAIPEKYYQSKEDDKYFLDTELLSQSTRDCNPAMDTLARLHELYGKKQVLTSLIDDIENKQSTIKAEQVKKQVIKDVDTDK